MFSLSQGLQTILLSYGTLSFAVFIYANTEPILNTADRQIGFDSGDGRRSATLLPVLSVTPISPLETRNIFRIDGSDAIFTNQCIATPVSTSQCTVTRHIQGHLK